MEVQNYESRCIQERELRVSRVSEDTMKIEATLATEAMDNVKAEKQDV